MATIKELIDDLIEMVNVNTKCGDYEVDHFFWHGSESKTIYRDAEGDEELTDTSDCVCLTILMSRAEKE
jgi:hypothetical protein